MEEKLEKMVKDEGSIQAEKTPHKVLRVNSEYKEGTRIVQVGDVEFGKEGQFVFIAGPCAVESEEQTLEIARAAKNYGASMLRGGVWKPRTDPYTFRGLGEEALKILLKAREETGLPIVCEVMTEEQVKIAVKYDVDMLQIGTRNMRNAYLIEAAARTGKPILFKRAMDASTKEWLSYAEYAAKEGNLNIVLCERGISTWCNEGRRNTYDIQIIPLMKQKTFLPIIVDPSHATGNRDQVHAATITGLVWGAHGAIIEMIGENQKSALCDFDQSIRPDEFERIVQDVKKYKQK